VRTRKRMEIKTSAFRCMEDLGTLASPLVLKTSTSQSVKSSTSAERGWAYSSAPRIARVSWTAEAIRIPARGTSTKAIRALCIRTRRRSDDDFDETRER
jgi:hypothetical protein